MTIWDLVLTPIFLLLLLFFALRQRERQYPPGHPLRKYFLPGLYLKFGGAIFIGLVYAYYYKGGDTFNYFGHAQIINSALGDSVDKWVKLIAHYSPEKAPEIYSYTSQLYWYDAPSEYTTVVITALLGLLSGTTYMPTALLFAFISYTGIWAMYRTFVNVYPALHRPLAFAFLFIPSTIVWGSSIFKDTICMFSLGWMTYCTFRIFINKDFSIRNIFLLALSFYLLAVIKIYILLSFVPALSLWLLMSYSKNIKTKALRILANFAFVFITAAAFLFFATQFAEELKEYSLENIAKKAKQTQNYITAVSDLQEGSAYDLGEFDPTAGGMLQKLPQAIMVTLFRPFLWEVKKPIMALSAIESLFFTIFTGMVFYRLGIRKIYQKTVKDPNLLFFLTFSLIFAFAVGISTGNFGSLSRYKIPCMPFFAALLVVLYFEYQTKEKPSNQYAARQQEPVRHLA